MKAASLKEIQSELENLSHPELVALLLRLGRFKKENKELLTYLLYESFDEPAYIGNLKKEISEQFSGINTSSSYYVKKSLRKILRLISKYTRYTGSPLVETELLLHFCASCKESGFGSLDSQALQNIYRQQFRKIEKSLTGLHEDLRYDYLKQLNQLDGENDKA